MKLTTSFITLVASAAIAAASFTHSPGTPDGIYKHFTDAQGVEHAEWVGPLNTTAPLSRRSIHARGPAGVNCQSSIEIIANDAQAAQNTLANSFSDNGLTFHKKISAVSGTAVAFGCDYGNGQTMYKAEFLGYMSAISTNCGSTSAGYYNLPSSKSSYGRTNSDLSFC